MPCIQWCQQILSIPNYNSRASVAEMQPHHKCVFLSPQQSVYCMVKAGGGGAAARTQSEMTSFHKLDLDAIC